MKKGRGYFFANKTNCVGETNHAASGEETLYRYCVPILLLLSVLAQALRYLGPPSGQCCILSPLPVGDEKGRARQPIIVSATAFRPNESSAI